MSGKTFFSRESCLFPVMEENKEIKTVPFLLAVNQFLPIFDKLGNGFGRIKNDIGGNVKKLEKKHAMNVELFTTIDAMLEDEATKQDCDLAQTATLWLKRGLEYYCTFLENVYTQRNDSSDLLASCLSSAYEKTLKRYHGIILQGAALVLSKLLNYRSELINQLKEDKTAEDDLVYSEMEVYTKFLRQNVEALGEKLTKYNLNSDKKV